MTTKYTNGGYGGDVGEDAVISDQLPVIRALEDSLSESQFDGCNESCFEVVDTAGDDQFTCFQQSSDDG